MPWKYSVRETLADTDGGAAEIYDMMPVGGETSAKGASGDSGEITLGHLTNSMMTSTSFSKTWVDSDGDVIDEDLLGVELSVDFTLKERTVKSRYLNGAMRKRISGQILAGLTIMAGVRTRMYSVKMANISSPRLKQAI